MSRPAVTSAPSLWQPPGGAFVCALVLLEMFTFFVAIITFWVSGQGDPELFAEARTHLDARLGLINTVVLLTSGYAMALSVDRYRRNEPAQARRGLGFSLLGGGLFLIIKGIEYREKIDEGLTLSHNLFFTYYWLLTVFHLMHVLVGIIILLVLRTKLARVPTAIREEDYAGGAAFWHMCDLIWLVLFPTLYLVF